MTSSTVFAVQDATPRATEQAEIARLSLTHQEVFVQALLAPPDPNVALKRAFERRHKLLREE